MTLAIMHRFLRNALWFLALVLTCLVCLLNIFYRSDVASTGYEIVTISGDFFSSLLALIVIGSLAVILSGFQKKLKAVDEKTLFCILLGLYAVLGLYLIFNVDNILRADAKMVFETALNVKNGIFTALQWGQYMYRYPHQLGLMQYNRILSGFSENPSFLFFANLLLVLGINYTVWKISDELFHDRITNVLTIVISFAFLPQLFFILFAYGLIPGFLFLVQGFYQTLKYTRTKQIRNLIAMVISVALSVMLKQNFLIGGIAITLYLLLRFLENKNWMLLAVIPLLIAGMLLPASGLKQYYAKAADTELDNPSPTVLWIAMGTDIDNCKRGPGWYDSSSWNLYNESGCDTETASELGKQKLKVNLEKIKADPKKAYQFFLDKTISQWCDPMYESTWSGPLEDCGQYTHTDILQSLYTGGTWAEKISAYLKILCLALWVFAAVFLLLCEKKQTGWEPMYLYFIGGLLFHLFWEGKSQYTYPYLFVLIPFAACAIRKVIATEKL